MSVLVLLASLLTVRAPESANAQAATPDATPGAIALPNGQGSLEGMGESFSASLSSGGVNYAVPLDVPPGRNGVAPELALTYSSGGGAGLAGVGWSVGVPFIARSSDHGVPRYQDAAQYHPAEDSFMLAGGGELVPVSANEVASRDGGSVPAWLSGYQQYRSRSGSVLQRMFRSPASDRWVVQGADGTLLEFGRIEQGPSEAVAASATAVQGAPGKPYRWWLTRQSDVHGSTIYYRYEAAEGEVYPSDVYYVSPASCGVKGAPHLTRTCTSPFSSYGARVRFVYEARTDVSTSYASGTAIRSTRRLKRVEMTTYADSLGARALLHRYHLSYVPNSYHSVLASVQLEGRPDHEDSSLGAFVADLVPESALGASVVGRVFTAMRFSYTGETLLATGVEGFPDLDMTLHSPTNRPRLSARDGNVGFFDINRDGLVDLIETNPAKYRTPSGGPAVGVYFNGFSGAADSVAQPGTFSDPVPLAVDAKRSQALSLANPQLQEMDLDGDGSAEYLHMPRVANYGYFVPARDAAQTSLVPGNQGYRFAYVPVALPPGQTDPRLDLGQDAPLLRFFDVDGDGLLDAVMTTSDTLRIWFNLGRYPGGHGRLGSASLVDGQWTLSTTPTDMCLPWKGRPVRFDDAQVRVVDMNGDGLADLARMGSGEMLYWPSQGDGTFGTGARCSGSGFSNNTHVSMASAPYLPANRTDNVFFTDLDGDGLVDLARVTNNLEVWYNKGGEAFSARVRGRGLPSLPDIHAHTALVDIDASGTSDIVVASSTGWWWVDVLGGTRPRLLRQVDNGLGMLSSFEYASSSEDYLRDLQQAKACTTASCDRFTWQSLGHGCDQRLQQATGQCLQLSGQSPVLPTVVRRSITTDRMAVLGGESNEKRIEYAYHDAYYEGIERSFRGFGAADTISLGDVSHPTSTHRQWMHVGRRPDAIAADASQPNLLDPLTGTVYLSEVFDAQGTYLSSTYTTQLVRTFVTGLNGQPVQYVASVQTDELRYSTAGFVAEPSTVVTLPLLRWESVGSGGAASALSGLDTAPTPVRARGTPYEHLRTTRDVIDALGRTLTTTAHGRVGKGEQIISQTRYAAVDSTLFLMRVQQSWTEGHGTDTRLAYTSIDFDGQGDPIRQTSEAKVPLRYGFEGDSRGAQGFAVDERPTVVTVDHDAFGNRVRVCAGGEVSSGTAGCLRLFDTNYDDAFAQFPRRQAIWTSQRWLETIATWERGTGQVLSARLPSGGETTATYDGLGRITSVRQPPVQGCSGAAPTQRLRYAVTSDPAALPLSYVETIEESSCTSLGKDALRVRRYMDGVGRIRAELKKAEAPHGWVRSSLVAFDAKGEERASYPEDLLGDAEPSPESVVRLPSGAAVLTSYDAFGRKHCLRGLDEGLTCIAYHALAEDVCDPLDHLGGLESGTCLTVRKDGHGRNVDQVQRNRLALGESMRFVRLWSSYRADDALLTLTRAETENDAPRELAKVISGRQATRTFAYDSLGRRIGSSDADTDARKSGVDAAHRSYRYLYNRVGDPVAMRDPRGCGRNLYYDQAGRVIGERYVGCAEAQPHELPEASLPVGAIALEQTTVPVAVDARYHFDTYPAWASGPLAPPSSAGSPLGLSTAISDRAQRVVTTYDARSNVIQTARQVAVLAPSPGIGQSRPRGALADLREGGITSAPTFDVAHTYVRTISYDHAGRPVHTELPRDPDFGEDEVGPAISGRVAYNVRGLPASVWLGRDGVERAIVSSAFYNAEGLQTRLVYGDDRDGRAPTELHTAYDAKQRVTRRWVTRTPTVFAGPERSLGGLSTVIDQSFGWNLVDNLTSIVDERDGTELPDGYRPQSVDIAHDALYRVTSAFYGYTHDDGVRRSGDTARALEPNLRRHRDADPMHEGTPNGLSEAPSSRVVNLTWEHDWLGNLVEWSDDAGAFYDRSLGRLTHAEGEASGRPSALRFASDLPSTAPVAPSTKPRGGYVSLRYGEGGNVRDVEVSGACVDRGAKLCWDDQSQAPEERSRLLAERCSCQTSQRFEYRWDESNRLADARRYDFRASTYELAAHYRYRYDAANQRVIKEVRAGSESRFALSVYEGDFERRGLVRGPNGSYEADSSTETQYLVGGARVVWKDGPAPLSLDADHRITVSLTDLVQSTGAVIDLESGELLELSTYYPNGAQETLLSEGSEAPLEPLGFTGKEADEDVGLTYFGERYLMPHLGHWASPDPLELTEEDGGENLNNYHYISGNLLQGRDPIGLNQGPSANEDAEMWFMENAQPLSTLPKGCVGCEPGFVFVHNEELPADFGARSLAARKEWVETHKSGTHIFIYDPADPKAITWEQVQAGKKIEGWIGDLATLTSVLDGDTSHCYGDKCKGDWKTSLLRSGIILGGIFGNPFKGAGKKALGKLTKVGAGKWKSTAGLIYGTGSQHGNRVKHVLAHGTPDPSKPIHSVFDGGRKSVLSTVDEAWLKRGKGVPGQYGNTNYVVEMGRVVGTNGETAVKIVIKKGTVDEVITAHPF